MVSSGSKPTENFVEVLSSGEKSWGRVAEGIRGATNSIHLAFWMLDERLELERDHGESLLDPNKRKKNTLFSLLNEKRKVNKHIKIRILLYCFPGSESRAEKVFRWYGKIGTFEIIFQKHPLRYAEKSSYLFSWHQKSIIIDNRIAFVSGMNAKENDWDTASHFLFDIRRAPYATTARERMRAVDSIENNVYPVEFNPYLDGWLNPPRRDYMAYLKGPAVVDIARNFKERWNYSILLKSNYYEKATVISDFDYVITDDFPKVALVQMIRTIPESILPDDEGSPYNLPKESSILDAYLNAINEAKVYIYIENQYFRDQKIATAISLAKSKNPSLDVIIVTKKDYAYESRLESFKLASISTYWTAKAFDKIFSVDDKFTFFYLNTSIENDNNNWVVQQIDIHSKIMIIDDKWYTIGSANVNLRSMDYDGELNLSVETENAKNIRKEIFSELLGEPCPENWNDAINLWKKNSSHNGDSLKMGKLETLPKGLVFPFRQLAPNPLIVVPPEVV